MRWFHWLLIIGLVGLIGIGLSTHWSAVHLPASLAGWATFGFVSSGILIAVGAGISTCHAAYPFVP